MMIVPVDPKVAYDVRDVIVRVVDNDDFLEIQPGFAANIVIGFGRLQGRPVGIVANQPCVHGRGARHRRLRQVGAVCALLQRLQHSAAHVCGCAGISAGRGAGARRNHPPRSQAAVCVLGGDGTEDHGGAAQGLRRRVHRDVLARGWAQTAWWRGPRRRSR